MKELAMTDFIRASLPAIEREQPFHWENLARILSATGCWHDLLGLPKNIETPKYKIGKNPLDIDDSRKKERALASVKPWLK